MFEQGSSRVQVVRWSTDVADVVGRPEEFRPDRPGDAEKELLRDCVHIDRHLDRLADAYVRKERIGVCLRIGEPFGSQVHEQAHNPAAVGANADGDVRLIL
jgi:hypothetical protein